MCEEMACQKQMVIKSMFIAISIFVVTSKDIFGKPVFSRACYGTYGDQCANTNLSCGTDENVLISEIVYKGKEIACSGECTPEACCDGENKIPEKKILNLNKTQINEACSGKQSCTLLGANYALKPSGRVTSTEVKYYCIQKSKIINYCEKIKQSNTTVHIMYNGKTDHYANIDCYCTIQSDYDIDLYFVDIRLQDQNSTSPQCTNTTLKLCYNQHKEVVKCRSLDDHSRFRKLVVSKDTWVQLTIQDENPTMVWIAAKATSGKVNVTCGQRNVNTQGTTSTVSTTSQNTTIDVSTQSISTAIKSKSDSGSTTVPGSTMSPTVSTTVQLHEPSANSTIAAIGPHSQNMVSADDTNIGAIVGPVIGIVIIAVLIVIGLILLRRRKAKQQSCQSTTTRDYGGSTGLSKNASDNITYGYDISVYDISKPIVTPTRSTTSIGEPVALFTSLDVSHKQSDGNAISDVVDDVYSEVNTKDMVSDNPSRNDDSESDYNHLHGLKACATNAHSGNVYSHLKTSLRNTSPSNDGYDHFGCNKPNSMNENNVKSLSSNHYDHLSSINMKNVTDCNHPITTHTQIDGNRDTPGGVCAVTSSHQIEPSCEYAKVQRRKPVAASDYEMAELPNDADV